MSAGFVSAGAKFNSARVQVPPGARFNSAGMELWFQLVSFQLDAELNSAGVQVHPGARFNSAGMELWLQLVSFQLDSEFNSAGIKNQPNVEFNSFGMESSCFSWFRFSFKVPDAWSNAVSSSAVQWMLQGTGCLIQCSFVQSGSTDAAGHGLQVSMQFRLVQFIG